MSCPTNCVSASWPCTWFTRPWRLMCILLQPPVRSWTVTSVTRPTSLSGVSVGVSPKSCLLNISGARRLYHTFAFHLSLILRAAARDFFSAIRAARRGVAYLRIDESGRLERRADGFTSWGLHRFLRSSGVRQDGGPFELARRAQRPTEEVECRFGSPTPPSPTQE